MENLRFYRDLPSSSNMLKRTQCHPIQFRSVHRVEPLVPSASILPSLDRPRLKASPRSAEFPAVWLRPLLLCRCEDIASLRFALSLSARREQVHPMAR
jgi:hypothetical protein